MADINIEHFKNLFFEESEEGLERLESLLVQLGEGVPDSERINDVFRVVHSLKGGGATFGFERLVALAHILETYLDMIRKGVRQVTTEGLDVLIQGSDKLNALLRCYKEQKQPESISIDELISRVELLIQASSTEKDPSTTAVVPRTTPAEQAEAVLNTWNIVLEPEPDIFMSGNDPLRFIRELARMGTLSVKTDTQHLPALDKMVPEKSYFHYHMQLLSSKTEQDIREVFSWIEDKCTLAVEAVSPQEPELKAAPQALQVAPSTKKPTEEVRAFQDEKSSIRVHVDKIDQLLNTVGELVIIESMLNQIVQKMGHHDNTLKMQEGLQVLEQTIRDLQESVMRIRMVPIQNVFSRVPRIIYDLSKKLGKQVELKISGEQTELDKTVLEKLGDPLVHLVRNALDHGLESPEERLAKNKPEKGVLKLAASHHSGSILIEISDDGRGINKQRVWEKAVLLGMINPAVEEMNEQKLYQLLFEPGFSTAEKVSEVSGRGVGMDVVKKNIQSLGGYIHVKSKPNEGTTFSIQLPLTLAILDGQLVRVGQETFIIPLVNICETVQVDTSALKTLSGVKTVYQFREDFIPVLRLHDMLRCPGQAVSEWDENLLIVVEEGQLKFGITVDELLNQQQVVIKTLEENFRKLKGISGATILGDGRVSLILDVPELVHY